MKSFKLLIVLLILLLVVMPLVFAFAVKRVQPDIIGVKQVRWGGGGFVERDFEAGFHLGVSGYHLWHFLPKRTHFIHFTTDRGHSNEVVRWEPPLEIRAKDGNTVTVELSIPFHIKAGEGHKILQEGIKIDYLDRAKSTMVSVIKSGLPELTSEDLQDPEMRRVRTKELLPILNQELGLYHVVADDILIRRFDFLPDYEEQLQEKQYLRQKAQLDTALAEMANEQKTINLIEKQIVAAELALVQGWEKKLQEKRSEYQVLIAQILGETEVYSARTMAEGDAEKQVLEASGKLALEQADALRNKLRTEALNSKGGRILLALEAAKNLNVPSVTLNSDDPSVPMLLDLHALTSLLVGADLMQPADG